MRPIAPRIDGAEEVDVAEGQHEYMQIVGAVIPATHPGAVHVGDNPTRGIVFRYTMNADERSRIASGEDIYLTLMAGVPVAPHHLRVGFP